MEEHEAAELLAGLALAPVWHVSTLRMRIEAEQKAIEELTSRIVARRLAIAEMEEKIQDKKRRCEAVFMSMRAPPEAAYLEEVRKARIDPVFAREQYALLAQRVDIPASSNLRGFAIRPDNVVLSSESKWQRTMMSMPTDVGEVSFTLEVDARKSAFLATSTALYAISGDLLTYCKYEDGVAVSMPGTIAAFSEDKVYIAKDNEIYELSAQPLPLPKKGKIKAFAVHGGKVALRCGQLCSLYTLAGVTEVPPLQCDGVSSVGICGGKLVMADRNLIKIHGEHSYDLPKGQDWPRIVSGPRCIVQTRQGHLYELRDGKRLFLGSGCYQAVFHNGLLYYLQHGKLTQFSA